MRTVGICDLETTGLLDPGTRIIEVALATYEWDGAHAKLIDQYVERIDPQRSIEAGAKKVHGITETDLIGKPTWDIIGPELARRMNKLDVCSGHNFIEFDLMMLVQEWERIKCPLPDFDIHCTMISGRFATPYGAVPNLGALCWACNVDYDPELAHSALYDVMRTADCLFYGLRRGVYQLPEPDVDLAA